MAALRTLLCLVLAAAATSLALPVAAQNQTGSAGADMSRIWLPGPGRSYLGLNAGRSRYNLPCGSATLLCDDSDRSVQLYTGKMIGDFWGVELGYLNMGRVARLAGETNATGLNLRLVGRAPLGHSFGVFGKVGTTYRPETSIMGGSGIAAGSERGFGPSYGAGVSFDINPRMSATLEWDSNDFRFAGTGRDAVRSTSLGLQIRY
ncbi:MAG TPA: outer membrane beta-barrel protein [Ramlibacter sp.]|nr:outer membrane beta-barrel protein [Ramlibacter sp.]